MDCSELARVSPARALASRLRGLVRQPYSFRFAHEPDREQEQGRPHRKGEVPLGIGHLRTPDWMLKHLLALLVRHLHHLGLPSGVGGLLSKKRHGGSNGDKKELGKKEGIGLLLGCVIGQSTQIQREHPYPEMSNSQQDSQQSDHAAPDTSRTNALPQPFGRHPYGWDLEYRDISDGKDSRYLRPRWQLFCFHFHI